MSSQDEELAQHAAGTRSRGWGPLILVLGCASAYALFLGVPFVVNDLHRIPVDSATSGAYDPKDLWPATSDSPTVRNVFGWGAMWTVMLAHLSALVALFWAMIALGQAKVTPGASVIGLRLGVLAAACWLGFLLTPLGRGVLSWWLD